MLAARVQQKPTAPRQRACFLDVDSAMATVFRAEVAGSLLRPPYLKEARARYERGDLARDEFGLAEARAVDEAIALQEEAGLDVVTDGEMRRADFMAPLYEGIDGAERYPGRALAWRHVLTGEQMTWRIPFRVTGKLRCADSPVAAGFAYARARAHKPLKQVLPSPLLANWAWDAETLRSVYSDPFELLADATAVVHRQALELASLGCRYVQIDAPDIAGLADPERGERHPASGIPAGWLLSDGIDLLNTIPAGISGVTFAMHLCRGNIRSHYATSGGYGRISRQVFGRLTNFEVFLLEYDDDRAGGFGPLADCPEDKTIVLGLISSKIGQLEEPATVAARVSEAARYYPREQLALSTQCGFATDADGNEVTYDQQRAKLALVARLAHQLWP
jgi:5-methyltetrahydropteroyltriglutamate--homocysteine methyltransferase